MWLCRQYNKYLSINIYGYMEFSFNIIILVLNDQYFHRLSICLYCFTGNLITFHYVSDYITPKNRFMQIVSM